jgi:hypothetical protein
MFIVNQENIKNKIQVNNRLAKYLIKHEVPILAYEDGKYYFADTEIVQKLIKEKPWYI